MKTVRTLFKLPGYPFTSSVSGFSKELSEASAGALSQIRARELLEDIGFNPTTQEIWDAFCLLLDLRVPDQSERNRWKREFAEITGYPLPEEPPAPPAQVPVEIKQTTDVPFVTTRPKVSLPPAVRKVVVVKKPPPPVSVFRPEEYRIDEARRSEIMSSAFVCHRPIELAEGQVEVGYIQVGEIGWDLLTIVRRATGPYFMLGSDLIVYKKGEFNPGPDIYSRAFIREGLNAGFYVHVPPFAVHESDHLRLEHGFVQIVSKQGVCRRSALLPHLVERLVLKLKRPYTLSRMTKLEFDLLELDRNLRRELKGKLSPDDKLFE